MFQTIDLSSANSKLFALLASVFTLGTLALVVLALGAVALTIYIVELLLTAIVEMSTRIAVLYSGSDSLVKILIICLLLWAIVKVGSPAIRSAKHSFPW